MICGFLPFEDPNTSALYKKILKGNYETPSYLSPDCKSFLSTVLNTDPVSRALIEEV